MSNPLPTLSLDGFIQNDDIKMVKIFEHFMASDEAQSNIFEGYVNSLKYILDSSNNATDLENNISNSLLSLYRNYYDTVEVEVTVTENVDDDSEWDISIEITATDIYGNEYSFNRSLHNISSNIYTFDVQLAKIYEEG